MIYWRLFDGFNLRVEMLKPFSNYLFTIYRDIKGEQRWEFIKENKKVRKQEKKNSTKKATK